VVVGDDSLTKAIIKLRKAFGDDARNPRLIETIPKRGSRIFAPVSAVPLAPAGRRRRRIARWSVPAAGAQKRHGILLFVLCQGHFN